MKAAARTVFYFVFALLALPFLFAYDRLTGRPWRVTRLAHWALGWHKGMTHAPSAQSLRKCWCTRNEPLPAPLDFSLSEAQVTEALAELRSSQAGRDLIESLSHLDPNRKHP